MPDSAASTHAFLELPDLAAERVGGAVVWANDEFFAEKENLLKAAKAVFIEGKYTDRGKWMDGWETRRSRNEAPDWAIVELAAEGTIDRLEIDTSHFKGNFPESAAVHGVRLAADRTLDGLREEDWLPVLARTKLQAHTRHHYESEVEGRGPFTHLRLRIYPDGGIARFRVLGAATTEGRAGVALRHLQLASDSERRSLWRATCGAEKFVEWMTKVGCESLDDIRRASNEAFDAFGRDDWLEAFRAHPRIGEQKAKVDTGARAGAWSGGEQARVHEADAETRAELAAINSQYENRFGFVYIVCATGRTAAEMLAFAKQRMTNDPAAEINVAATEQRKITALRIDKLLGWS